MRVCFVSHAAEKIVSRRLRVDILADAIRAEGLDVVVADAPQDADLFVFQKHFRPEESDWALKLRQAGKKIVFDICDWHLQANTHYAEHYMRMLKFSHVVTCATHELQKLLWRYAAKRAHVVHDPYEIRHVSDCRAPSKRKRVLWHGHHSNLDAIPDLPAEYDLRVVCNKESAKGKWVEWTPEAREEGLRWCDVVIVPQFDTIKTRAKSHNRITESVRSGRFVVASKTVNEYEFYRGAVWLGDISEGLKWAFAHPQEAQEMTRKAQSISERFSPQASAKAWIEALGSILGQAESRSTDTSTSISQTTGQTHPQTLLAT